MEMTATTADGELANLREELARCKVSVPKIIINELMLLCILLYRLIKSLCGRYGNNSSKTLPMSLKQ